MVTKEQVLTARCFHLPKPSEGKCMRWYRNGRTQTWKTQPNRFRVPIKFGLYTHDAITNYNAPLFHVIEDCPYNGNEVSSMRDRNQE